MFPSEIKHAFFFTFNFKRIVSDSHIPICHHLIHQAMTRTMKSGWLILQMGETRRGTAASWASKRLTGGWRNNLCAETGEALWWARSKAPACAPEKITYGTSDLWNSFIRSLNMFWLQQLRQHGEYSPALTSVLFNSDYGYYRHVNTSECVRQSGAANKTLELCLNGEEDELLTAG